MCLFTFSGRCERAREKKGETERSRESKREQERDRERERKQEREREREREREKREFVRASEREREREIARHQTINVERQRERRVCVISQALGDLVELGHTRVGEGHVDVATTPPALVLGIVRGRRLLLARLVPRHIMGCGDLRSLKKKIKSAFVTTCLDTHTQAFRV